MQLLKQELVKIWRPGILAVLALLGAFYYVVFLSFDIQYFPNGPYDAARFHLAAGWTARFGPTLEPEERAALDEDLRQEQERFRTAVASNAACREAGIADYGTFRAYVDRTYEAAQASGGQVDMEREALIQRVIGSTNYPIVSELENFLLMYDQQAQGIPQNLNYSGAGDPPALAAKCAARIAAIAAGPQRHGYIPVGVFDATGNYSRNLAGWMLLSVVVLLSPVLVRDRLSRTRALQWSSRRGRRILHVQMAAALLSALALTALNLALFGGLFLAKNGVLVFRDCGLFSLWALLHPWFDWTYGGYLAVLGGMLAALSLAAAGLTVFLSQYSGHYVAMLLKALPLFAALKLLADLLLEQPFLFENRLSRLLALPGAEAGAALALLALGLGLCLWSCRRQRRRELLQP